MQKIIFTLCLFLAVTQYAAAQEQYIEVVVSDTILVEPQQWFYNVSLEQTYDYTDTTTTEFDTPPKPTSKKAAPQKPVAVEDPLKALRALAVANGGQVLPDTGFVSYNVTPIYSSAAADAPTYFNVKFTSRAALQGFVKAISNRSDVRGQLTGSYNPQLASFNEALDAKLIEEARTKAERLAQLSGRKLGKVLLVSEVTESDVHALRSFFNELLQLEKTYGKSTSGWNDALQNLLSPDKIKLEGDLRLRFALQ